MSGPQIQVFPVWALNWYREDDFYVIRPSGNQHSAVDIFPKSSEVGAPILSSVPGMIENREPYLPENREFGGWSWYLRGDDNFLYYFAHAAEPAFRVPGERVGAGALLGFVGNSGNAKNTLPHLHLQAILLNKKLKKAGYYDPVPALDAVKPETFPWPPPFDIDMGEPGLSQTSKLGLGLAAVAGGIGLTYLGYRWLRGHRGR